MHFNAYKPVANSTTCRGSIIRSCTAPCPALSQWHESFWLSLWFFYFDVCLVRVGDQLMIDGGLFVKAELFADLGKSQKPLR